MDRRIESPTVTKKFGWHVKMNNVTFNLEYKLIGHILGSGLSSSGWDYVTPSLNEMFNYLDKRVALELEFKENKEDKELLINNFNFLKQQYER